MQEELDKFIKSLEKAEKKVESILTNGNEHTEQEFKNSLENVNYLVNRVLNSEAQKWADEDINKAYKESIKDFLNRGDAVKFQSTASDFEPTLEDKTLPYIELRETINDGVDGLRANVNSTINDLKEKQGYVTIEQVKNELVKEYSSTGLMTVTYNNGAKVNATKYMEMLARTSRIITENKACLDVCNSNGCDLVRFHALPTCCPNCQKYNNKVYSISGTDSRFPFLYGANGPYGGGGKYKIVHPNCRCYINAFIPELHKDELDEIITKSNDLTEPDKNDKMFAEYRKQQAFKRELRQDNIDFQSYKQALGDDFPYKTVQGYRRGKKENSEVYRNVKYFYKSKLQNEKISKNLSLLTLEKAKQEKHLKTSMGYVNGKSYFCEDINFEKIQNYVKEKWQTGEWEKTKSGNITNKKIVEFDRVIGYCKNISGEWVETNRAKIHYSKNGVHLVPTLKEKK